MSGTAADARQCLPEVRDFLRLVRESRFFRPDAEVVVARAPGRLDVMGGIADYSGSLVLELPLSEAVVAAVQRVREPEITVVSRREHGESKFQAPLAQFTDDGAPIPYEAARAFFACDAETHWASYVAGAFLALMREAGARFVHGARIFISSTLPEGKGVSSSAALEVAAMQAVSAAFGIALDPRVLALLCQKVENHIAGAPCGVMDQMAVVFGRAETLMALRCQPAELEQPVPIPAGLAVWGIDSGVRHYVSGADYAAVRVGAFMGRKILSEWLCLPGGYLANLDPAHFEAHCLPRLPEAMRGSEFLEAYGETGDSATRVDPDRTYAVRIPTAHPVRENGRVRRFCELLRTHVTEEAARELGALMFESHESYSACGLGCPETDLIVGLVRAAGSRAGLLGAKITGGGCGGTVAILGRQGADEAMARVASEVEKRTGYGPKIFSGSSSGAADFGYLNIWPYS